MRLSPFFTFYGGKWRAAKHYQPPTYRTIVEPFAGSAGYSLNYPDREVRLVDLDPAIVETWRFLITASPDDVLSLPDLDEGQSVRDLDLPDGARHLIGWWLNHGTASPRQKPSKWMRDGTRPGSFWGPKVRATIARQVGSIRHWHVELGSYADVENRRATWFVDPPYQAAGTHYKFSSKRINFEHLAEWSRAREGQLIVCENTGADWLPFRPLAGIKSNNATRVSAEAIYESDPSSLFD